MAESLTGGLVGAALTEVPGSSAAFRGGVLVYATDLKASLAGVPDARAGRARGGVAPRPRGALAEGVRDRLGATYGVGVTGVAGPDEQEGQPVGTVHVARRRTGRHGRARRPAAGRPRTGAAARRDDRGLDVLRRQLPAEQPPA